MTRRSACGSTGCDAVGTFRCACLAAYGLAAARASLGRSIGFASTTTPRPAACSTARGRARPAPFAGDHTSSSTASRPSALCRLRAQRHSSHSGGAASTTHPAPRRDRVRARARAGPHAVPPRRRDDAAAAERAARHVDRLTHPFTATARRRARAGLALCRLRAPQQRAPGLERRHVDGSPHPFTATATSRSSAAASADLSVSAGPNAQPIGFRARASLWRALRRTCDHPSRETINASEGATVAVRCETVSPALSSAP